MINNVFYVILVFLFFLLIIKCEYVNNEKEEVVFETDLLGGGAHHEKGTSSLEGNYAGDVKIGSGTEGGAVGMQLQGEQQGEEGAQVGMALSVEGSAMSLVTMESEPKAGSVIVVEAVADGNTASGSIVAKESESKEGGHIVVEEAASSDVIRETESESGSIAMVVDPIVVDPIANDTAKGDELKAGSSVVVEETADSDAVIDVATDVVPVRSSTEESESKTDGTSFVEEAAVSNGAKGNEPKADAVHLLEEPTDGDAVKESEHIAYDVVVVEEAVDSNDLKVDEAESDGVVSVEEPKADDDVKENEHTAYGVVAVEEAADSNSAKESEPVADSLVVKEEAASSNTAKGSEPETDGAIVVEEAAASNAIREVESKPDNIAMVDEPKADDTPVVEEASVSSSTIEDEPKEDDTSIVEEPIMEEPIVSVATSEESPVSDATEESEPQADSTAIIEEPIVSSFVEEGNSKQNGVAMVDEPIVSSAAEESESKPDNTSTEEESIVSSPVEEGESNQDGVAMVEEAAVSSLPKESELKPDDIAMEEETTVSSASEESEPKTDDTAIVEESTVSSSPKEIESKPDDTATVEEAPPERRAANRRKPFLVEYQERVNQYDQVVDEIILRSLNRENYNFFNMLDEYAMRTQMSGEMYTGMRYLIKVLIGTTVVTPSYKEKKKSFNYKIEENTFKRHFVTSLFRWYNNFKLVESHFDKANYVYYVGDERVYSYRYSYRLVLNLLSSETFSFYLDLNKFTLLEILDSYNRYSFKLNNSPRYYPFHMYTGKSLSEFVGHYFEFYNHRYFEKHRHLIAEEVHHNGIKKSGNKLFAQLSRLNPNFVLYPFGGGAPSSSSASSDLSSPTASSSSASSSSASSDLSSPTASSSFASSASSASSASPPPRVEHYLDAEVNLVFSIFEEFLVNLLNDLYNEYYNDGVKRARREGSRVEAASSISAPVVEPLPGGDDLKEVPGEKTQWEEVAPLSEASSAELSGSLGIAAGAAGEAVGAEGSPAEGEGGESITGKHGEGEPVADKPDGREAITDQRDEGEPTTDQRDDPLGNELWRDLLESYKEAPKAEDLKKYNQYILKNLNKILNLSTQKERQRMEDYKNKYELKDGFIVNVSTARHTPLLFNPSKDVYAYLSQMSSKKQVNFKNVYDYLMTIIRYKEGSNFYDGLLQSRRVAGGLWRGGDSPGGEVNGGASRGPSRPAKRVIERVVVHDGELSTGMKANELNANELNSFLLFIERGEEASGETAPPRAGVHSFYRSVNLSEFTPAAVNMKDQIHDQLKLLKKKYTEKLKSEATCVLAFLYLIGINDNGGKLQLPYGFPRNIDHSVRLIRKGKDGLCNFLSGILYHLNLPIFVNNSSISITTEMSEDLVDSNENALNSFFYIYYRNNGKIRNHHFLSNENRIIPKAVDNMKSKIVSYSLGSTKEDFYSKLAFTNNMIRLKYKNEDSNIFLRDYFDFTFDKKVYKNAVMKNNISPFLSSCDYLLSNILGAVVDSLKNTSVIESGVYEESISEKHRHLINNTVDHNKSLFEYFLKLADSRNSYALAALGEIYYLGNESIGIERDEVKAFEFWKKAADQGDTTSALSTGYAYLDEYKKHLRKEEVLKAMSKEDVLKMIREEKGGAAAEGVKKEHSASNKPGAAKEPGASNKPGAAKEPSGGYFPFASEGASAGLHTSAGQPAAQQGERGELGELGERGSSPERGSPVGAPNFMGTTGAAADFPSGLYGGGSAGPSAPPAQFDQSTRFAASGYASGQAGVPLGGGEQKRGKEENTADTSTSQSDDIIKKYMQDLSEERNKAMKNAEHYFQKAIRNNEESVEHVLAKYNIYKFGLGTEKNLELAGDYLKKAADKGDNISQMMLGHLYSGTDIGVKVKDYDGGNKMENLKKSYKYYSLSAKSGNIISLYNKSILILKGVNPNLKTFNEKCEKTLKQFHFIGLFNERLYVLTKLLRRSYDFRDYTGSLLLSVILSELGDHPNNVNASMLWDLKRRTMQTFTERYNLVEGLLADLKRGPESGANPGRNGATPPLDRIIHRLYKKGKGGKYYSLQGKAKLKGHSILKSCAMVTRKPFEGKSVLFNVKFCRYLRDALRGGSGGSSGGRSGGRSGGSSGGRSGGSSGGSNRAGQTQPDVHHQDVYELTQTHKQIDLFERYDQIVKSEMEKGGTPREKIQRGEKMKGTILEHFRTSEFLHCYYKPISYYQIKLEEEKRQSLKGNAQQERSNLLGRSSNHMGYNTPGQDKSQQVKDLYETEFSRYSPLLEGEDMKELFYYQNTYSSNIFEEIQSFSKNCDVCKQHYDIYSAYYGYKKSTLDLIRKYREGDEYTIKSKRKELQFLIRNSDEEDHEPLYYKALFLENNKLDSLKNILQIYLKLATDSHNACNVIGVLGIFKILFKKVFFDVTVFFSRQKAQLMRAIREGGSGGSGERGERGKHDERGKPGSAAPVPAANSLQRYLFTDLNSCALQSNFLFKSEFHNKCLNFDHLVSSNHAYSQLSYRDFFKLFYTVVASFFKAA
ncbi:conserved Plasmodium protein, unknown function [Plasmodium vivax]|uniref:Sel1 repeat-containing protein n=1 Tax=Plasmodium vivax TaxID=5855 RepID=A0A1G4GT04_PLAVI|nr:conserved Plasmodium protein, unknown function [Plasmodium vivax]